jgi:hypothetical protein
MTRTAPRILVALTGSFVVAVLMPPWQSSAAPVPKGLRVRPKVAFDHAAEWGAAPPVGVGP